MAAIPEGTIIGPVLEVHIVEILDESGIEVAIPSIANPTSTSYVVTSREAQHFVNEIHVHKEELRSSNELLKDLHGSVKNETHEERKGSSRNKETCAPKSIKETYASFPSIPPTKASLHTQRTIPTNERKWKVIHAHSPNGGYVATAVSKMVTKMLRHCDQEERQTDDSRHWDNIKPTFVTAFARVDERVLQRQQWISFSNKSRIDELHGYSLRFFLTIGRSTSTTEEFRGIFNLFLGVV